MLDPKQPTTALPGTADKIDEMHRRARLVLRLHHPDDAKTPLGMLPEQSVEMLITVATDEHGRMLARDWREEVNADLDAFHDLQPNAETYWTQLLSADMAVRIHAMRCLHGMGVPLDTINQHTPATVLPPIRVRRRRSLSRSHA